MSNNIREICFNIYESLKSDDNPLVVIEALRCVQHLFLFAPKYVPVQTLVPFLQIQIRNDQDLKLPQMRKASITCFYQLTQKDPQAVLGAVINDQLEEQLLSMMDTETDELVLEGIRDILVSLLKHVAPERPSRWINLCKSVLSKGASTNPNAETETYDDGDEEPTSSPKKMERKLSKIVNKHSFKIVLSPRWRTQVFVVQCVRQSLDIAYSSKHTEHFNLDDARAKRSENPSADFLVFKLPDLIGIAFNAATTEIKELNLEGLNLLQDIILKFAASKDPDVEGHWLLEQYQVSFVYILFTIGTNQRGPYSSFQCRCPYRSQKSSMSSCVLLYYKRSQ
jgi:hypothetical protein